MRGNINRIFIYCISMLLGIFLGGYWMGRKYCLKLIDSRNLSEKHLHIIRLYDVWMMIKETEKSMEQYLINREIRNVAIYGMSFMGVRLFHELKDTSVCIKYGIDLAPKMGIPGLDIYRPDEIKGKEEIDAIIVTAIFSYDSIRENLERLGFTKIFALDEILYDLL